MTPLSPGRRRSLSICSSGAAAFRAVVDVHVHHQRVTQPGDVLRRAVGRVPVEGVEEQPHVAGADGRAQIQHAGHVVDEVDACGPGAASWARRTPAPAGSRARPAPPRRGGAGRGGGRSSPRGSGCRRRGGSRWSSGRRRSASPSSPPPAGAASPVRKVSSSRRKSTGSPQAAGSSLLLSSTRRTVSGSAFTSTEMPLNPACEARRARLLEGKTDTDRPRRQRWIHLRPPTQCSFPGQATAGKG